MKSNKLLGLFVVFFFVVQVWSSDNKENLENKIEIETDELNIEFQEKLEQMINYFGEEKKEDIRSLLQKKIQFDENLKSNLKTNEDICDHDLVLDLSNLTPEDIEPDVFKYWSYIKFPSKKLQYNYGFTITGSWKDVKYFQFDEKVVQFNKKNMMDPNTNFNIRANITFENIDDGINLDPNRHHFPKTIVFFHIHSCKIKSLRFPEGTSIEKLWFDFDKTNEIQWESVDLPKVPYFNIKNIDSAHIKDVTLKDIEKIQNATHVETLHLENFNISELNLEQFSNLKKLKIDKCYFESHSKIMVSKNFKCSGEIKSDEIRNDDNGTLVTKTYEKPESDKCLII